MPGILDTLTRSARIAFPIIQRGVREGLSANRIQDVLSGQSLGIRRQTLLDIIRFEKGVQATIDFLRRHDPRRAVDPARLPPALTRIRRAMSFTVEVTGHLVGTTEQRRIFVTVSTDRLLTPAKVIELGIRAVERSPDRYGLEIEEARIGTGVRAGPAGTF